MCVLLFVFSFQQHWSHARSKDFIHWEHLPIALYEANDRMMWSGSSVADYHNTAGFQHSTNITPLIAVYTSHRSASVERNIERHEEQSIAVSYDGGKKFTQYSHNPVLDIGSPNFRDPKVLWYEDSDGSGYWVKTVVLATQYQIVFYKSLNLINWIELSRFGPAGSVEGVWECPDLIQLTIKTHHPSHSQSTAKDEQCIRILTKKLLSEDVVKDYRVRNGVVTFHDKYFISPNVLMKNRLLQIYHDHSGHVGWQKTYELLNRLCYWPNMFDDDTSTWNSQRYCF